MTKKFDTVSVITKGAFTMVLDAKGDPVQNWYGVNIAARPGKRPVIQVNMMAGAFNLEGVPTFMAADPAGGPLKPVAEIRFWDGTGLKFPAPPPTTVVMQPPAGAQPDSPPAAVPANDAPAEPWRKDLRCLQNNLGDCIANAPEAACQCRKFPEEVYKTAAEQIAAELGAKPDGGAA